jgi:hypothetical protein|tara:strand:+ start:5082 stop:5357 length:276 start_codon:yes stop_codon:yes gene_type:complete
MLEIILGFIALVSVAITFGYLHGKTKERLGGEMAMRKYSEASSRKVIRGIEKLMVPRPTRRVLLKHWNERLRKATSRDVDSSLPDSDERSD